MLHRLQSDILIHSGQTIETLLQPMQAEHELFDSTATLNAVEAHLLVMAQTLAHLAPPLVLRLDRIDWQGWGRLQRLLESDDPTRQEAVWYGVRALVPATLALVADLRRREPGWFGLHV